MSEMTPDQIRAQTEAATALRKLRRESETYFERRDDAIEHADATGMSLRAIGSEIGMSPQGVSNILKRIKGE
jgi:hypothetical protein